MNRVISLSILLLLMMPCGVTAETTTDSELFQAAANAYRQGDVQGAEQDYHSLIERGIESPSVLYNLGQLYREQGRLGRARAEYLRALELDPRHQASRTALKELGYRVPWPVRHLELAIALLLFNGLAVLAFVRRRRWLGMAGLVCVAVLGMASLTAFGGKAQAVMIAQQVPLRRTPEGEVAAHAELASLWTVEQQDGRWVLVRHSNQQYWVPRDAVELVGS